MSKSASYSGRRYGSTLLCRSPGRKPEALARLDRGARQDDTVHLALAERRDRRGDGEVRFARTCGADADGDGVFQNGLDVFLLSDGLGLDGAALELMQMTSCVSSLMRSSCPVRTSEIT